MLHRTLPTTLLLLLALVPGAAASPRAHSAAEARAEAVLEEAEALLDGEGVRTGRELSVALLELSQDLRHLRGDERERAVSLLSRPDDSPEDDPDAFDPGLAINRLCSLNFCVHSVGSGIDVPSAGMAALTLAEAETIRTFEVGTLGWRSPPRDGGLGGDSKVDIYLKELGSQKLFGYAATDTGQDDQSQHSYLVIDNDFDPAQYGGVPALESLRVTLAHEYGHVLQYGYDVTADGWHYESSAVWLEQRIYPEIKDWLRFVTDRSSGAGWQSLTELPLTAFDHADDQPRNAKPYGTVVWQQYLSETYGAAGDAIQRGSWEFSDGLEAPSTAAYQRAIQTAGGSSLRSDFASFATAVAEWRTPGAPFPFPGELPDVERRGELTVDGPALSTRMDHLTFGLWDVAPTNAPLLRLAAVFPEGTSGALALVGRSGAEQGGEVTTRLLELPDGGAGGVTLESPGTFFDAGGRVTAVLVNSDSTHRGYDNGARDWAWSRDGQAVVARLASSAAGPGLSARTPGPGAEGVSTRSRVSIQFSEPVVGVDGNSFVLRNPRGRKVPATVSYSNATRTATLTPTDPLADTTRYLVRVGSSILNGTASPLSQAEWTFTTVRRAPRASLSVRDGLLSLRSRDRDRLTYVATLRQDGRRVGRRSGRIRPGATKPLRIRGGEAGKARAVVVLTDPQGNTSRLRRGLRLLP